MVFVFFTRRLGTFCGCGMGIEVVCRMRLQKKPMVLGASVPARAGQICTLFLMAMFLPGGAAAVLPYAENLASASPFKKRQDQTWQRVARWNVEREDREPKVIQSSSVVEVNTGDFGTNARHLPRKRHP